MVRVKAPLFSFSASGTLAKSAVFANWRGRDYVRRHAIPANPNSSAQQAVRALFKFITQDYSHLTAADISDWKTLALSQNITALNAQVRDASDLLMRGLGWRENTTDTDPAAVDAPINCAAAAQSRSLQLSWQDPALNAPDYCYAVYSSTETGFTPGPGNLIAAVKSTTHTYLHRSLTSGSPYYYRIRGLSTSGFLGDLTAQFTGTPT